jgi:ADP-ribose pyrophosphatase YjhB (NUDIX family)
MEIAEPVTVRCSTLVLRDGAILLCRHRSDDEWVLPGGAPHRNESPIQCAERETLQETSIAVRAVGIACVFDVTNSNGLTHLYEMTFAAVEHDVSAQPRSREDELSPSFVCLDVLGDLRLRPAIAPWLRGYAAATAFPDTRQPVAPYLGNMGDESHEVLDPRAFEAATIR